MIILRLNLLSFMTPCKRGNFTQPRNSLTTFNCPEDEFCPMNNEQELTGKIYKYEVDAQFQISRVAAPLPALLGRRRLRPHDGRLPRGARIYQRDREEDGFNSILILWVICFGGVLEMHYRDNHQVRRNLLLT